MRGANHTRSRSVSWVRENRHHLFFGGSFLLLAALVSWWALHIHASEEERFRSQLTMLQLRARVFASLLGHVPAAPGSLEGIPGAQDLQLLACGEGAGETLHPFHPQLCIAPSPAALEAAARKHRSRTVMVLGEGALSLALVLVTGWMFFRLVSVERRSRRELRELWSRVSHEIKTPITGVKALLQTLEAHELPREEVLPLLRMALGQVDRQERLAENLLMGQHLERDGARLHPRPLAIEPFLREYVATLPFSLAGRALELCLELPVEARVRADPSALRVILDNLLDNAVKYGGEAAPVRLEAVADGSWTRIHVVDRGAGFPPEAADAIFEAFRRLSDELPGGQRGTGMGLAIARGLARRLGGMLTATSDGPGRGARFTLSLETEES